MPFDFMGVSEFAAMTGRHPRTVRYMVTSGVLLDSGYSILRLKPKRGRVVRRIAIGVPITAIRYTCPDCGKQWDEENTTPAECPSCKSPNVERRQKVA